MKPLKRWRKRLEKATEIEKEVISLLEDTKMDNSDTDSISPVLENIAVELRIMKTRIFDKINVLEIIKWRKS